MKLKLVTIEDKYINYLKKFSENVKYNKNSSRPYVGIVLIVNNYNYFAPLGSPKPKHLTMKENIDFLKIDNGKLGVINLNNMIPAPNESIKIIDFLSYDVKYKELLKDQAKWIYANTKKIEKKSEKLYKLITEKENTIFHKRVNNFKLLEKKLNDYENKKEDIIKKPCIKLKLTKEEREQLEKNRINSNYKYVLKEKSNDKGNER